MYIGVDCSPDEVEAYTKLFEEFQDVFAYSYEEILGVDPHTVEHSIRTYLDVDLFD